MFLTIRNVARSLIGQMHFAVPAMALIASVGASSAWAITFPGGCTQGRLNQVCTSIRLDVFQIPGGETRVVVVPSVETAGVLRQGSMTSDFSAREQSPPFTFWRSATEYCSWNGIDEAGCSNGHFLDFPCQTGVTVDLGISLDASSNILDSIDLTSHHQSLLVHLKHTNSCVPIIVDPSP